MIYKVKNVSLKRDVSGKPLAYCIIVCPKTNEDDTKCLFYSINDANKLFGISNETQAMALVGQFCEI